MNDVFNNILRNQAYYLKMQPALKLFVFRLLLDGPWKMERLSMIAEDH